MAVVQVAAHSAEQVVEESTAQALQIAGSLVVQTARTEEALEIDRDSRRLLMHWLQLYA